MHGDVVWQRLYNRLLAEVGKRERGKGERFGIFPFPNKDASL